MTKLEKHSKVADYEEATKPTPGESKHKFFAWVGLYSESEHLYYIDVLASLGLTEHIVPKYQKHIVPNYFADEFYCCVYGSRSIEDLQNDLNYAKRVLGGTDPVSFLASGTAMILGDATKLQLPCALITPQTAAANYCSEHGIKRVGAIYPGMQYDDGRDAAMFEGTFFWYGLMANDAVEIVAPADNEPRESLDAALLRNSDSSSRAGRIFLTRTIAMLLEKFLRSYGKDERMPRELVISNLNLSWLIRNDRIINDVIMKYHLEIIDAVALQLQAIVKELI